MVRSSSTVITRQLVFLLGLGISSVALADEVRLSAIVTQTSGVETKIPNAGYSGTFAFRHDDKDPSTDLSLTQEFFRNDTELVVRVDKIYYSIRRENLDSLVKGTHKGEFVVKYRWQGKPITVTGTCQGSLESSEFRTRVLMSTLKELVIKRHNDPNHTKLSSVEAKYVDAERRGALFAIGLTEGKELRVCDIHGSYRLRPNPLLKTGESQWTTDEARYVGKDGKSEVDIGFDKVSNLQFGPKANVSLTLKSGSIIESAAERNDYKFYCAVSDAGWVVVPRDAIKVIKALSPEAK